MPSSRTNYRLVAGFALSFISLVLGLRGGDWLPVLRDLPLVQFLALAIIWPTLEFLCLSFFMAAVLGLWVFGNWELFFLAGFLVTVRIIARYTKVRSSLLVGVLLPGGILAWHIILSADLWRQDPLFILSSAFLALAWGVMILIVSGELGLNRVKVRR